MGSVIVAFLAGTAGILSLTSAKSGALIGVVISVTTIPAAANVGLAAAYRDATEAGGAAAQLGINLGTIMVAGMATLYVQRFFYLVRRRRRFGRDGASEPAEDTRWRAPGATAAAYRMDDGGRGGRGRTTDAGDGRAKAKKGAR